MVTFLKNKVINVKQITNLSITPMATIVLNSKRLLLKFRGFFIFIFSRSSFYSLKFSHFLKKKEIIFHSNKTPPVYLFIYFKPKRIPKI